MLWECLPGSVTSMLQAIYYDVWDDHTVLDFDIPQSERVQANTQSASDAGTVSDHWLQATVQILLIGTGICSCATHIPASRIQAMVVCREPLRAHSAERWDVTGEE